jgi:hypothetical protein
MREAPPEFDLCWRELAIVAKALADGRDMTEIGMTSPNGPLQCLATARARITGVNAILSALEPYESGVWMSRIDHTTKELIGARKAHNLTIRHRHVVTYLTRVDKHSASAVEFVSSDGNFQAQIAKQPRSCGAGLALRAGLVMDSGRTA